MASEDSDQTDAQADLSLLCVFVERTWVNVGIAAALIGVEMRNFLHPSRLVSFR